MDLLQICIKMRTNQRKINFTPMLKFSQHIQFRTRREQRKQLGFSHIEKYLIYLLFCCRVLIKHYSLVQLGISQSHLCTFNLSKLHYCIFHHIKGRPPVSFLNTFSCYRIPLPVVWQAKWNCHFSLPLSQNSYQKKRNQLSVIPISSLKNCSEKNIYIIIFLF